MEVPLQLPHYPVQGFPTVPSLSSVLCLPPRLWFLIKSPNGQKWDASALLPDGWGHCPPLPHDPEVPGTGSSATFELLTSQHCAAPVQGSLWGDSSLLSHSTRWVAVWHHLEDEDPEEATGLTRRTAGMWCPPGHGMMSLTVLHPDPCPSL